MSQPIWSQNLETPGIGYANKVTQGNYTWWHGQSDNLLENPNGRDGLKGWNLFYNAAEGWAVDAKGGFKTSYFWNKKKRWVYLKERNKVPVPSKNEFEEAVRNGLDLTLTASEEYSRTYCTEGRDSLQRPRYEEYYLTVRLYTEYVKLIEEKTVGPVRLSGPCDWNDDWKKAELSFKIPQGSQVFYVEFEHGGVGAEPWGGRYGPKMRNAQVSWRVQPRAIDGVVSLNFNGVIEKFNYTALGYRAFQGDVMVGFVDYDQNGNPVFLSKPKQKNARDIKTYYEDFFYYSDCSIAINGETNAPLTSLEETPSHKAIYDYTGKLLKEKLTGGSPKSINCPHLTDIRGENKHDVSLLSKITSFFTSVKGVQNSSAMNGEEFMSSLLGGLWPSNDVFYVYDPIINNSKYKSDIDTGVDIWNTHSHTTGLRFHKLEKACSEYHNGNLQVPPLLTLVPVSDYIYFDQKDDCPASSPGMASCAYIGKQLSSKYYSGYSFSLTRYPFIYSEYGVLSGNFSRTNTIRIGRYAATPAIVAHEIGHTIGLIHEQNRPDRDTYLIVNEQSILDVGVSQYAKLQNNSSDFYKRHYSPNYFNRPYGFASVMHYGPCHYSNMEKQCDFTLSQIKNNWGQVVWRNENLTSHLSQLTMYPKSIETTVVDLAVMGERNPILSSSDLSFVGSLYDIKRYNSSLPASWKNGETTMIIKGIQCSNPITTKENERWILTDNQRVELYKAELSVCAGERFACEIERQPCLKLCVFNCTCKDCSEKSQDACADRALKKYGEYFVDTSAACTNLNIQYEYKENMKSLYCKE